ncbi:hypothetical protein EYD10_11079 [Varanus komodoensis]|nr:hypothetical protein EYD10_11079 [Varanus komodoensis]
MLQHVPHCVVRATTEASQEHAGPEVMKPFSEVGKKLLYQVIHLDVGALKGEREYSELVNGFAWVEDRRLCLNGTPWIWHLLEECVGNAWEYWSVVIGLISIVCFLFAALPQLYVAYKNGKVDQALSLGFLVCWISGDLTNFIGCYLTNQLPIQSITAIFYINMDVIMISQFVYYKLKNQKVAKCESFLKGHFCNSMVFSLICFHINLKIQLLLGKQAQATLLGTSEKSHGMMEMSGFICGYISCAFYLGSRIPQLYKNVSCYLFLTTVIFSIPYTFQRRSTEGTSYLLFALAMMGNCTYGLSIVLKMPSTQYLMGLYFWHHLPWLIGSFGVLFLDILLNIQITAQFIKYYKWNKRRPSLVALEVEPLLINEDS